LLQNQASQQRYRLVYQVIDQEVTVFVVAVDKRERDEVYRKAADRLG
jgi:mRNA interferase RelE/StbE